MLGSLTHERVEGACSMPHFLNSEAAIPRLLSQVAAVKRSVAVRGSNRTQGFHPVHSEDSHPSSADTIFRAHRTDSPRSVRHGAVSTDSTELQNDTAMPFFCF